MRLSQRLCVPLYLAPFVSVKLHSQLACNFQNSLAKFRAHCAHECVIRNPRTCGARPGDCTKTSCSVFHLHISGNLPFDPVTQIANGRHSRVSHKPGCYAETKVVYENVIFLMAIRKRMESSRKCYLSSV